MNNKVSNDKNKNFHTDNPISKKEFDTLGRGNFSERIGEAISNYSGLDSLVIGIYGEWGTGKTSVINMIEDAVVSDPKTNKKTIIVNFRPWYFSGQDHLFQQFFGQLAREIVNNLSEAEKKSADKAIKIRRLFKNFILAVEGLNAVVDEVGMPAEKTRKFAINFTNILTLRRLYMRLYTPHFQCSGQMREIHAMTLLGFRLTFV